MPVITTAVEAVDFGAYSSNGVTSTTTATQVVVGHHFNTANAGWAGYRFPIPENIDPSLISQVKLKLRTSHLTNYPFYTIVKIEPGNAVPFETSGANRVDTRWGNVTSFGQVVWSTEPTYVTVNTDYRSPDLKAIYEIAFNAAGGTGYVSVMCSGQGGRNSSSGMATPANVNTAARPTLEITWDSPPQDADVTTVAPSASFTTGDTLLYNKYNDISYDDGIDFPDNRILDIITLQEPAPVGGWPIVFFIHGGAFGAGSEDDAERARRWISDTLGRGFAIVSVKYKLTDGELNIFVNGGLGTNTGWTRPHSVQDAICALKWLTTQTTYDLNSDFIVGVGYSAGGHLLMEAALLAEDSTPNAYSANFRGVSSAKGSRFEDYPNLYHTGNPARTGIPTLKGVFTFGGPWDLPSEFPLNPLLTAAMNLYYGAYFSASYVQSAVLEEGDLGAFIEGRSGTIYEGRVPSQPSFPIAISYATGDTTVPTTSSYTPMRASLDAVGYDVSQDVNEVVASGVALSRHGYVDNYNNGGGHDGLMLTYSSDFYTGWLDEVISLTLGTQDITVISTAPSMAHAPGGVDVSIIQAAGNAEVTTSAPSIVMSAGGVSVDTVIPNIKTTAAIMDQSHINTGGIVNAKGPAPLLTGTFDIPVSDDAGYTGGVASLSQQYYRVGYHFNTATRGWMSLRFLIPDGLVNSDDIQEARLVLTTRTIASSSFKTAIRVEQANAVPFQTSGANRPDNRFNAVTSVPETVWQFTPTVNVPALSPDITAEVQAGIAEAGGPGNYLGIHLGAATGINATMLMWGSQSENYPILQITMKPDTVQGSYFNGVTEVPVTFSYWDDQAQSERFVTLTESPDLLGLNSLRQL